MGHIKVIQSGKIIEIFEYEKDLRPRVSVTRKKRPRLGDIKLRYIRSDNARRRLKSFRRLVTSNFDGKTAPALLTLTMYEVVSLRRGYASLHKFIRRLRGDQGKSFRYVAVPEFQKRGAVHFHIIVWGLDEKIIKEEYQTRYIQSLWQRGFVDCVVTDGSRKLIGYLSKYMSKSMSDERLHGEKAYVASGNVLRSVSISSGAPLGFAKEIWDLDLSTAQPLLEREFSTQWLGKGRYRIFEI